MTSPAYFSFAGWIRVCRYPRQGKVRPLFWDAPSITAKLHPKILQQRTTQADTFREGSNSRPPRKTYMKDAARSYFMHGILCTRIWFVLIEFGRLYPFCRLYQCRRF